MKGEYGVKHTKKMNIIQIANKIKEKQGNLYLVGGAVRDKILGRPVNDEDYCITGLTSNEFLDLFPEAKIKGKKFEVYELKGKEFAIARKEKKDVLDKKVINSHKNFEIITNKEITIQEDLSRRDITINSIAEHVLTGEIIDPFGGKKDLENKTIRATTKAFKEDPLRVYRVARFAAELEFIVEENTMKMMNEIKHELNTLPGERIFNELKKALNTNRPSIFFEVLKQANVLDVHFKEIFNLIGALQPKEHHPEGDSYVHTLRVLDSVAEITKKKYIEEIDLQNSEENNEYNNKKRVDMQNKILEIRFAALVHDLGKGITPKSKYPHHYNHEVTGVKLILDLSKRIKFPSSWIKCAETACREHMRGGIFYKMSIPKKVSFIEKVNCTILGLDGLQIIVNADKIYSRIIYNNLEVFNEELEKNNFEEIGGKMLSQINGKYIMEKYKEVKPHEFGNILHNERIKWMVSIK